jgi:phosphohistidine phosphatase
MKRIHLLRHAKSDWGDASLADIDRPLNARGIRATQFMAVKLVEAGCPFVNVFCSPAVRAQSTITLMSKQLSEMHVKWKTDKALYTFDSSDLHEWFRFLDESISECLIVGHNPALTNFCNELTGGDIQNIPTCGYVQLVARSACTWSQLSETPFEIMAFLKPKDLM